MRFDFSAYTHYGDLEYVRRWDLMVEEFREQALLCEQVGITTYWFPEHHFAAIDGWNNSTPNPVLMAMDLAARTKKLRVGTGGVSLPDWHPLRLAEDLAVLDIACAGRLDCGIMRGSSRRTNIQFNRHRADDALTQRMFAEILDILVTAWQEGPFSHQGEFFQFPVPGWKETHDAIRADSRYYAPEGEYIALGVHPKPLQKPHPPLWLLGDSVRSHEFAGARGIHTMCYTPGMSAVEDTWAAYRQAYSRTHDDELAPGEKLAIMKPVYVAPTMEQAVNDMREGTNALFGRSPLSFIQGKKKYINTGEELTKQEEAANWFDFLHARDLILVGPPDYVAERIQALRDRFQCEHLALFGNTPGMTHRQLLESIALFGERVMPHFQ